MSTATAERRPAAGFDPSLTLVTVNDDFTDGPEVTDVPAVVWTVRPHVIFVQEGKRTVYRRIARALRRKTLERRPVHQRDYGVAQVLDDAGTRGVAVLWDRARLEKIGDVRHEVLVDPPRGVRMEPRGATWVPVQDRVTGVRYALVSAHRPPWRYRGLWPVFDQELWRLVARLENQGYVVIVGTDANTHTFGAFARRVGGHTWTHHGIDGLLANRGHLGRAVALKQRTSDHRPVAATYTPPQRLARDTREYRTGEFGKAPR